LCENETDVLKKESPQALVYSSVCGQKFGTPEEVSNTDINLTAQELKSILVAQRIVDAALKNRG
jgi:hypothetical protein